jgi:hypothetical protein
MLHNFFLPTVRTIVWPCAMAWLAVSPLQASIISEMRTTGRMHVLQEERHTPERRARPQIIVAALGKFCGIYDHSIHSRIEQLPKE